MDLPAVRSVREKKHPPWRISGVRTDVNVTQTDMLFMGDNPLAYWFGVKPFTNRTLRLVVASDAGLKFKVRFLSSC